MTRPCPICDSTSVDVLHHQRFVLAEGHPLGAGYDVVCCEQCGFVYANTNVSQAEYDEYYASLSHYESELSTGGGDSPGDEQRLLDTAQEIVEQFGTGVSVLDVGCANGGLLRKLREIGMTGELVGVDPSPVCVRNTQAHGVRGEVGGLFDLPSGLGTFDVVVLSHVLEHVQDAGSAIENLKTVLADGGGIFIESPDASRYKDHIVAPLQDFNTEHINHFSPRSLANLMARRGLRETHAGRRVLQVPPPTTYPALSGVFRIGDPGEVVRDTELREDIEIYIERSREILDAIDARLRSVLERSPEVVVWGTGQLAMKLLAESALGDAKIVAFIDGNRINQGQRLQGAPILAPDEARNYPQPIVVTTTIHQDAIARTVTEEMGLTNELVLLRDALAGV
jgi:2-polyprenyl-3-methyl-5-hydroxy-6-metoxy-1,4-benzoquinol methylase